jgi:hypothetical protein
VVVLASRVVLPDSATEVAPTVVVDVDVSWVVVVWVAAAELTVVLVSEAISCGLD